MAKHAPSHLTVAGYRVLISYDGQPVTCYGCGKTEHIFQDCPTRQAKNKARTTSRPDSYANVLANTTPNAETNRQDNSETEIQSKTKTHDKYLREVQRANTSQGGLAKEEKDEPKQKSRIAKNTTVQQIETPPNTETQNYLAPAEHSSMEIEETKDTQPTTQNDDDYEQDTPTERQMNTPPPDSMNTERDSDKGEKGLSTEKQSKEDERN